VTRRPQPVARLESDAARLQELLRARGAGDHVAVRAARGHLQVETRGPDEPPEVIARATPLGGGAFGLSFHSHTGRWEPMPVGGTMEDVAEAVTDLLGPYIDPHNLR